MNKNKGVISVSAALALLLALGGCGSNQSGDEETVSQVSDGETAFSYSEGIDDNGHWKGVTALDYVELFDYQAIPVPSSTHVIPDERVQSEVDSILSSHSTNQEVADREVVDGDTVNIDYVGSVDGVEFEGGTTNGAGTDVTIGVTSYIDDFLEQLIGHTPGETFNVEVTFPEEYGKEELNGKDAVFVTTINYIVETVTPELTDDFVNENLAASYGWTTVAEMNEGISTDLQKAAIQSHVQEYLMENVNILSLPDEVLSSIEKSVVNYYQEGADYYEMEIDEFLGMYQGVASVDELLEVYHDSNVEQGNYGLTIQAVAEDAKIDVSDSDVKTYFADFMGTDDYSQYEEQYGMPFLKQTVLNQLVINYLVDHAVLQ